MNVKGHAVYNPVSRFLYGSRDEYERQGYSSKGARRKGHISDTTCDY
jgi:hypothetical protein